MNKEEKEQLIRQFLDGELDRDREKTALRLMADEEEYRELLRLEIDLNRVFNRQEAEAYSFAVPEGFGDQVMEAIEVREEESVTADQPEEQQNVVEWLQEKLEGLMEPRPVTWRPAYGLAAIIAVLAVVIALNLGTQNTVTPSGEQQMADSQLEQQVNNGQAVRVASITTDKPEQVWARFFYVNDQAKKVAVAGDFSNWEPVPLDRKEINGKTVWTNSIQMKKGEHRYMYIINGNKWKTDPLANRYMKDGFGNRNAVISL